jgi:hypothetical protein
MRIGLLDVSGVIAVRDALPGSILFQIAPQDQKLAVGIILGFRQAAREDGDSDAVVMLESVLAEIGGEYSPLENDSLDEVFDIDVRVLWEGGDATLRGADARTIIFLFDPLDEAELAVDVLESAISLGLFCGVKAESIRAFIESTGAHPTSLN